MCGPGAATPPPDPPPSATPFCLYHPVILTTLVDPLAYLPGSKKSVPMDLIIISAHGVRERYQEPLEQATQRETNNPSKTARLQP